MRKAQDKAHLMQELQAAEFEESVKRIQMSYVVI